MNPHSAYRFPFAGGHDSLDISLLPFPKSAFFSQNLRTCLRSKFTPDTDHMLSFSCHTPRSCFVPGAPQGESNRLLRLSVLGSVWGHDIAANWGCALTIRTILHPSVVMLLSMFCGHEDLNYNSLGRGWWLPGTEGGIIFQNMHIMRGSLERSFWR